MNEPAKNARDNLGKWIVRLEIPLIAAGAMVVGGLLLEEWHELNSAYHERRLPSRETVGNILVTLGVAGEVIVAAVIARLSRNSDKLANREIAEINSATESLRKENAEMALLLSWRSIGNEQDFENTMRSHAGTKFAFRMCGLSAESFNLFLILSGSLERAGWVKVREPERRDTLGPGVAIATVANQLPCPIPASASALADWLYRCRIGVLPMATADDNLELETLVISVGPKPENLEQLRMLEATYEQRITPQKT